jgi:hypothetical protein
MLTTSALTLYWRSLLLVLANLVALLVYAVGLIAPLTPSEGVPSLPVILSFVGIPVVLLAWCIRACGSRLSAVFFGVQLAAILAFLTHLLLLQMGALHG